MMGYIIHQKDTNQSQTHYVGKNIMKMSIQDFVGYLCENGRSFKVIDDHKHIIVHQWCTFLRTQVEGFTTIPDGVVFEEGCNFADSGFTSIPDSTIIHGSLIIGKTINSLPPFSVPQNLLVHDRDDLPLMNGVYVGEHIFAVKFTLKDKKPHALDSVHVNGYFVNNGILS